MAFLSPIDLQGQFEKKGWCLRSLHGLLCLFIACDMSCEQGTELLPAPCSCSSLLLLQTYSSGADFSGNCTA